MLVCMFKIFSETVGPTETKFHVEPQWYRGRKFIQIIPVICCSSFEYCQPLGAGAFRTAFTTNVAPQCRPFSRALEIEKLKASLFRGPEGAGDTNDWCIKADEMKLCSQSAVTFPSRMITMARLRIMVAPVSPAALTISTTNGPAALPNFNLEMIFFTIPMVIGIGGPSSGVHQIYDQDPTQILH